MRAYGVASVKGPHWYDRLLGRLGVSVPGVQVEMNGRLRVEVPLALVEAVPFQRELGLTIDELVIVVDGQPMNAPAGGSSPRQHG